MAAHAVSPNPSAPVGGNFTINLRFEPGSLSPLQMQDSSAYRIREMVLDTLLSREPDTFEFKPRLAEKWEISKDGRVYTFYLRKGATFHDRTPVTAEDVKFSFDSLIEGKQKSNGIRAFFDAIQRADVVDPLTIRFIAKDNYFLNFDSIAELIYVLPRHVYGDAEKASRMTKEVIGSGPYRFDRYDKGQKLVLKKFDQWIGRLASENQGEYNFESITYRFQRDEAVYLEMVRKGDLDYEDLSLEQFMTKTEGEGWGKSVLKVRAENSKPKPYQFIAWNLRNPLFRDREARLALAHLMNREEIIKLFRFGQAVVANGPADPKSDYVDPRVKPINFDPRRARALLSKLGWKDSDKDGVLEKRIDGRRVDFRFTLLIPNKDYEKIFNFYKEDLKKAGIDMEVKFMEWNSVLKQLDDSKFDAVALAWQTSVLWDPKSIWHSTSAVPGGSNFIAYKNAEVDKLIDRARFELDRRARTQLLRRVYAKVAEDAPYLFMMSDRFDYYAVSSKVGRPADTFKYEIGIGYWWSGNK